MTTNYVVQFTTSTGTDICKIKTEGDFLNIMAKQARLIIAASAPNSGFHPLKSTIVSMFPDDDPDPDMTAKHQMSTGEIFYTKPEPQTEITFIRYDGNGHGVTVVDRIFMPTRFVNQDCTGTACRNLLKQILRDFATEYPATLCAETATWNNLFDRIPEDFLARYNVRIEPIDTMLTLEAAMDEPVMQAESE